MSKAREFQKEASVAETDQGGKEVVGDKAKKQWENFILSVMGSH